MRQEAIALAILAGLALPAVAFAQPLKPRIGETSAEFQARINRVSTSGHSAPQPLAETPETQRPYLGETSSEFEARRGGRRPSEQREPPFIIGPRGPRSVATLFGEQPRGPGGDRTQLSA